MKNTVIAIAMIALSAGGILAGCKSYKQPSQTDIAVLRDVTEKQLAQPKADEIMHLIDLSSDNAWNGVHFTFSNLTNVSYNQTRVATLALANKWLSNELQRKRDVETFKNSVSDILTTAASDTVGRRHSSIYIPIANQLTLLSQSKAQKKMLLIYSDLLENDSMATFYDAREFHLLQTNPAAFVTLFNRLQPLPTLTGITVYLIYQPGNIRDDNAYRVVSGFYKTMLQDKGATVVITANISN